ncbi:MAG: class I SAM-dependent methyltransferase [Microcystis aeruginosa LL13-03]|nr:class I SAM-dependent methyltransferase [Microcystis aeruginosa LL13-03]
MLRPQERTKLDPTQDSDFYAFPRFVTHVDQGFIDQLTALYREILSPNTRLLDLMSSWVSHLPEEMEFEHIEGHGMNGEELAKNPRLHSYFIQDLNAQPKLPLEDSSFDAVLITVSVQYLQYPEAIFAELYRILIAAWRDNSDLGRVALVKSYFQSVAGFREVQAIVRPATTPSFLQMLGIMVADPFYAVIGKKESSLGL